MCISCCFSGIRNILSDGRFVDASLQTARAGLCKAVSDAIRTHVRGASASPAEVPVDAIDSIIRREYSERGQGVTLYIMNPEAVQSSAASSAADSRAFRFCLQFICCLVVAPPRIWFRLR